MSSQKRASRMIAREYLRVSKDAKGRGKSTDQQHMENTRAISDQGWSVHQHPYRDNDRSASRYARRGREGFTQLVEDLEVDRFDADVLVIWESSRGSRRAGEWYDLIERCKERRVKIYVTTHRRVYDPENARDRRSLREDASDAEYESDKTSERIQRDVRDAAERGQVHGKNLYGYLRVYDPRTRALLRIEEHPEQAPVVKEAARRILAGESYYSVAKSFNERRIESRRPATKDHRKHLGWTPPAVKQMLTMSAYAGKRQYRGEIISDGQWPALIDPEVWEKKLLPILNDPKRKRTNDWPAKHLLTGIAVCDVCGAGTRVGKQNRGRKQFDENGIALPREHYNTYLCSGVPGKTGFHTAMKEEFLDQVVTELLFARLERPDFIARVGKADEGADAERQALIDEIDGHQHYLDEVRAQAAARHDLSILFAQEDLIKPKIAEAQRELERLASADPLVLDLAASRDVREAWEKLELADKRRVIRAVMKPRIKRARERGVKGVDFDRVVPGWL